MILKIQNRISEIEERVRLLDSEMAKEMQKSWKSRRFSLLDFIYKEKEMCRFAIQELNAIIENEFEYAN